MPQGLTVMLQQVFDNMLALLFLEPIVIDSNRLLWMIPICLTVAIAYKTIHCRQLQEIPLASAVLFITIVLGLAAVGFAAQILSSLLA